jgi:hypothetical protein
VTSTADNYYNEAEFYNSYSNPNTAATAQNPTIVPQTGAPIVQFTEPVAGQAATTAFSTITLESLSQVEASYPRQAATATVTLTGTVTAGDTALIELFNGVLPNGSQLVSTLVVSADTLATVAARLVSNINNGGVLNGIYGVTAVSSGGASPVITISWPGPVGNFTAVASWSQNSNATVVVGGTITSTDVLRLAINSANLPTNAYMLTLGGTATTGDVVTLTVLNQSLVGGSAKVTFTVATATLTAIATGIAAAINASAALTAIGMSANGSNGVVYVTWGSAYGTASIQSVFTRTSTETITLAAVVNAPAGPLTPSPAPGQTITIGGTVTTGDVLSVTINASGLQPATVLTYTALNTDTTSTIATAFASLINNNVQLQSAAFVATAASNVVTVGWNEIAGSVGWASNVAGVPSESATQVSNPSTVLLSLVAATSTATVAAAFNTQVNANVILKAAGVTSSNNSSTNTVTWNAGLNPLTITSILNGTETATIGGTVTAADVLTITVTDPGLAYGSLALVYIALSTDTTTTIATAFKNLINNSTALAAIGVTATSSAAVLSIASTSMNQTTYTQSVMGAGTETITLAAGATETITVTYAPNYSIVVGGSATNGDVVAADFAGALFAPGELLTLGGSATQGDVLTLTIAGNSLPDSPVSIPYTVGATPTLTTVGAGLVTAINSNLSMIAAGFNAVQYTFSGTQHIHFSYPASIGTLVFSSAVSSGATETITFGAASKLPPAFAQTTVTTSESTANIAAGLNTAINAQNTLKYLGITSTVSSSTVSITAPGIEADTSISTWTNGNETLTLGGSTTTGDVINFTVTNANISGGSHNVQYAVVSGDTTLTLLATHVAAAIAADATLTAQGFGATSSSAVVTVTYPVRIGPTTFAADANGVETATITGTATNGDTLNITVTDAGLSGGSTTVIATVTTSESVTSMATAVKAAINASAALTAIGVTATSSVGVVSITSTSVNKTTYTQSVTGGMTETITLASTLTETTTLAGTTETVSGTAESGSEILTPTTPMSGGAGPIIPLDNFPFTLANYFQGLDIASGSTQWMRAGIPYLVDYESTANLVAAGAAIK